MLPSSLHDARSPTVWLFQATQLTSCSWALSTDVASSNVGPVQQLLSEDSWNILMVSSPQAVAMASVLGHLRWTQNRSEWHRYFSQKVFQKLLEIVAKIMEISHNYGHFLKITDIFPQNYYKFFSKYRGIIQKNYRKLPP